MDTKFDPMSESTKRMREQNIADQKAVEGLNVYACRYSDLTEFVVTKNLGDARALRPGADSVRAATLDQLKIIALRALTLKY